MKRFAALILSIVMAMGGVIPISAASDFKLSGKYQNNKTRLSFTWTAVEGAERYYLQRKSPTDTKFSNTWNTTDLHVLDVPPEAGVKYTYRIAAKVGDGWVYSNKVSATLKSKPTYPTTVAPTDTTKAEEKTADTELRYYDMASDPTYAVDYVFPYEVGEMPGRVSEYITESWIAKSCNNYANKRFKEIYGYSIMYASNEALGILDYVDTDGVVKVYKSSEYKDDSSLYKKSKEYLENYGTVKLVTDLRAIPNNSVALFNAEPAIKGKGDGHYIFIEYVERDKNGNPLTVYYTDAGGENYKKAGQIQKMTFEKFLDYGNTSNYKLKGYLIPNTFPSGN